jgi:SAM-dependent methyltransferase
MTFEELMPKIMQWSTAAEALGALGAHLALKQSDTPAPPEVADALRAVLDAAGLGDVDELPPPQQAMLAAFANLYVHQASDLLEAPGRASGWTFTDPVILDGWGRGSMMVPPLIKAAHPDLADVTSLLDVGTGVGLLAVSATNVWRSAKVVGIDNWDPSLDRARANVAGAHLEDRITLREQELTELSDTDAFDCEWVPTFFITEPDLEKALPALLRALRPGGWIALGLMDAPPDPVAAAIFNLRTIRGGGCVLTPERSTELLQGAGFASVHVAAPAPPAPLLLILGQRPA